MAEDMTLFLVLAEYGTAQIPVERCASHFGMTPQEAKAAARRQALPVPCYRLGSQKSPWVVDAASLANHIRSKREAAEAEWKRIHAA
ncbi:pyocin activator PrtN family protein [Arenimonas fontis]|uniref:Pyocin activator protein PrtN n=1 Tax=Arenimonas fontis TaxID=2608255 RepID=A0A5B2ZEG6_9GAMM|nr:pyocin activator PrtN family protein [Arenimonas fontis]KAA2285462.1 pyocin activator protein PrtN [Arenimonas fontis]